MFSYICIIATILYTVSAEECSSREVECSNGQCVPSYFWCDSIPDCKDNSDNDPKTCQLAARAALSGGSDDSEGLVMIEYRGRWGTVCNSNFGKSEAEVICRMMGQSGGTVISSKNFNVKRSHVPVWLDQLKCSGTEDSILECSTGQWGQNYCTHDEDVAIKCRPTIKLTVDVPLPSIVKDLLVPKPTTTEAVSVEDSSQCGRRKRVKRIINGDEPEKGDIPWAASIRVREGVRGKHKCGATIITNKIVLTASHCVSTTPVTVLRVRVGDHHVEELEPEEQEFKIAKIVKHPDYYNNGRAFNDIAIVKIAPKNGQYIRFGRYVQPVCLPTNQTSYTEGKICTISGWGKTQIRNKSPSKILLTGTVPLLSHQECSKEYILRGNVQESMVCAGYITGSEQDSCQGDSGGSLTCSDDGREVLYGVTSWGISCSRKNKPGVYTKVKHYLPWLLTQLQKV